MAKRNSIHMTVDKKKCIFSIANLQKICIAFLIVIEFVAQHGVQCSRLFRYFDSSGTVWPWPWRLWSWPWPILGIWVAEKKTLKGRQIYFPFTYSTVQHCRVLQVTWLRRLSAASARCDGDDHRKK